MCVHSCETQYAETRAAQTLFAFSKEYVIKRFVNVRNNHLSRFTDHFSAPAPKSRRAIAMPPRQRPRPRHRPHAKC